MEAGARQYQFEELDAAAIVERVVAEFEPQISSAGKCIETARADSPCLIDADPEAISVALRNLLDNAVKYSPDQPTVWVECGMERERVAIRVRDKGLGIAASEREDDFQEVHARERGYGGQCERVGSRLGNGTSHSGGAWGRDHGIQ